ncbi:MAG: hypothetical protein MI754_08575, partial [Chromatiales bacterium]|nr:hypothetical protein [Chromatiales bacterium]
MIQIGQEIALILLAILLLMAGGLWWMQASLRRELQQRQQTEQQSAERLEQQLRELERLLLHELGSERDAAFDPDSYQFDEFEYLDGD